MTSSLSPPAMRASRRMDSVRAPIIGVVSELAARTPGTISLGQGIVSYGPPREALEAAERAREDPETHRYQAGEGIPALRARLKEKLRADNGIPVGPANRIVV